MSCALALHSCSSTLGVALLDRGQGRSAAFPLARELANGLFDAIAELLPASRWRELSWLAVATGPGSFTGTRLTLVLARTLAQQLQIPLYGYGSLRLIAERRRLELASTGPHWIGKTLPRRGVVAGYYGVVAADVAAAVEELEPPSLNPAGLTSAFWEAQMQPEHDARLMLQLSEPLFEQNIAGPWQQVLPIYPTSPVQELPTKKTSIES